MDVSIIIPTFNRKDILRECLHALARQDGSHAYEVILVDDASLDGTQEMIDTMRSSLAFPLSLLRQEKKGPAAARNLGIKKSSGSIILIMGDDIIAAPHLLKEHVEWHTAKYPGNNSAILGLVRWSSQIEVTPFMRWLDKKGWQFPYGEIEGKTEIDWKYLMTPNISFKRDFLIERSLLFDERFLYAALEDYEFGHRFFQEGGKLYYNPQALGYHHHSTTLASASQRMYYVGKSVHILQQIAPQLKPYKISWRKYIYQFPLLRFFVKNILEPLAYFTERRAIVHSLYACVLFCYFLKGLNENE
jgi:glycosyltransferase involved in cell wall biosynthesis